ncbi:MAG: carbamoyl-phosphate-synthetase [Desulfomonilaceae bacterium]
MGYLDVVNALLANGSFDVLLPTHEQAWLFAVAGRELNPNARIAVASADAFSKVQSKIEFARLLDELSIPQPKWRLVDSPDEIAGWEPPFYLKTPFSTAGTGVRRVMNASDSKNAFESLRAAYSGGPIMVQAPAHGEYAQVQALFDQGRLVAAHTSAETAVGIGPSAAGRVSVDHPFARQDVAKLGAYLNWHGGLTLDYFFRESDRVYIECNPRTVEPANAAASGVDLPGLQLALSVGEHPDEAPACQSGVRTHSSLAILLGTAAYVGTRRAILAKMFRLLLDQTLGRKRREVLTPIFRDPPSVVPLLIVSGTVLLSPQYAERISRSSINAYSISGEAIQRFEAALRRAKTTKATPDEYNDGYDCFRQLIQGLRDEGFEEAAGRLDDLLNHTAWTTGSELLGELGVIIRDFERTRPQTTSSLSAIIKECKSVIRGVW